MFQEVSFWAALIAGLLSFFSPCVLPLVPSYFSFISGVSLDELTQTASSLVRRKIIIATLAFVLGFSVIFVVLGASASLLGSTLMTHKGLIRVLGGSLIILLGLYLIGVIRIPLLEFDKRIHLKQKPLHFLGAFFIGMAFGAGWSPCIGPILGSILILASNQDTVMQGVGLLICYSAGLALPFLILSMAIHLMLAFIRRTTKILRYINLVAGILLVITGLMLVTDTLRLLSF